LNKSTVAISGLFVLLCCSPTLSQADGHPKIRQQKQLNEETRIWVKAIEEVKASGKSVSIYNDDSQTTRARLTGIAGPYIPLERIEYAWIKKNGTFGLKFKKKYQIDIPLKNGNYVRVKLEDEELVGDLKNTKTVKNKIPVQLLVFRKKHAMQIDMLGHDRKSTVPEVGKLLGMLPHIVALAYLEQKGVPYAAPQLDGKGASENAKSVTDLLDVEDTLPHLNYLPAAQ
jgi:hypothetical protein